MLVQTSFDSSVPGGGFGPHITVINHDAAAASAPGTLLGPPGRQGIITGAPSPRQLSRWASQLQVAYYCHMLFMFGLCRQGSSVESATIVPIHHHTAECAGVGRSLHQPMQQSKVPIPRKCLISQPSPWFLTYREVLQLPMSVTFTAAHFMLTGIAMAKGVSTHLQCRLMPLPLQQLVPLRGLIRTKLLPPRQFSQILRVRLLLTDLFITKVPQKL